MGAQPSKIKSDAPKRLSNFKIYNYLPNHSIKIDVSIYNSNALPIELVNEIKPSSSGRLPLDSLNKYVRAGNMFQVYIFNPLDPTSVLHFSDMIMDTYMQERIKALHIGMVTSRFIGDPTPLRLDMANAVNGSPWVKVHNLTYIPLSFNGGSEDQTSGKDGFIVEPHSLHRYQGYLRYGVPLGTYFRNDQNIFPPYQYLRPDTDLYYGIVSDLQQPLQGNWALEFTDQNQYGQTMWPLVEGVY